MQIKLKDLAQKTGFSITTVSRALAGYGDVGEVTRQKIVETAAAMGYQPNLVARQLRNQATQTLGLIMPVKDHSLLGDFFVQLLLGINDCASRNGYDVLISAHNPGEEEMAAYRRIVGGNRVDGMILARTRRFDPRIAYLQALKFPFVVSGRNAPTELSKFPYIDADSQQGIRSVVDHLIALGHQHIGLILPPHEVAFTAYRLAGYRDALDAAGIAFDPRLVVHSNLLREGGYKAALNLLEAAPELTAIVACNDVMALGAMSALQSRGLRIGRDVAVTGFDDIPAAEYANPPLTTIHQPIYEIGQHLVEMLLGIIRGETPTETQVIVQPTLVIRESSTGR